MILKKMAFLYLESPYAMRLFIYAPVAQLDRVPDYGSGG